MRIAEIYDILDEISPFELQETWDNSGLLIGSAEREISRIVLSLDIDEEMIRQFGENSLFILHHPPIFGKLSRLDFSEYPSNLIEKLILSGSSVIAMHTNFDKTHLNRYVFREILGLQIDRETDFICEARVQWSLEDAKRIVSDAFGLEYLKIVSPKERIEKVALTTGSGASLMGMTDADCFLTGDIKYHDAMEAMSRGLMMIDIGHYESERFFAPLLYDELKNLPISVIIAQSKNPFQIEYMK
jgi:dinuclear metal center YbgI/SA1388 family protein